jgi:hypothetical protein
MSDFLKNQFDKPLYDVALDGLHKQADVVATLILSLPIGPLPKKRVQRWAKQAVYMAALKALNQFGKEITD